MTARILDGRAVATGLKRKLVRVLAEAPERPTLAVVIVGDDAASQVYVRNKVRETEAVGMRSQRFVLPGDTTEQEIVDHVRALSDDPDVDGILCQLPLPAHVDAQRVLAAIDPAKDVDGLTETSAGRLALGKPGLRPCTPFGCVLLAREALGSLTGAHVVVLGRSILVGRPAALLFLAEDCTVTIAHSRTNDVAGVCRTADILVPAIGKPEFVRGDWIKADAVVLDVGINRVADGAGGSQLVGDVAFAEVAETAHAITPVPGGVGPMTIACLLRNTYLAAAARRGWTAEPSV
jgi:methylenetetrahydrofolate dehydrogenase (NADP+)/methenyltetrahydrofolate cyclohydrolase